MSASARIERQPRLPQREAIGREGQRRVAVHVARQLIEQDNRGQPRLQCRPPARVDAARQGQMRLAEPAGALGIQPASAVNQSSWDNSSNQKLHTSSGEQIAVTSDTKLLSSIPRWFAGQENT